MGVGRISTLEGTLATREMRAGIALGSNLGDRLAALIAARRAILQLPHVSPPVRASGIYETEPVNVSEDAGAFLNAVLEIEYAGQPIELLDALHEVEVSLGRPSNRPHNASRTIDLDVLYMDNLVLNNPEACIPHPRLHQRRFVLAPLAEIRPDLLLPGQAHSVAELLHALPAGGAVRLTSMKWDA